ncbi:MAG: DNA repair protein RadC [Chloroflexi bacterium]|nr:DNA repair protein RadC [Chloroflexota bacterium]
MSLWAPAEPARLQLRELPLVEQPLYRLQHVGPAALSNAELIELILGASESLGRDVLAHFGDLASLARANLAELAEVRGLGSASGARIQAALELGRRLAALPAGESMQIRCPADAASLLLPTMSLQEQETLRVLVLDTRSRVLADVLVYQGCVNRTEVRLAEVFREAIRRNAPSILVAHNHPSGDPTPSPEDVQITRQAVEVGAMLGIEVMDHLVIGQGRWVSLRERNLGFSK